MFLIKNKDRCNPETVTKVDQRHDISPYHNGGEVEGLKKHFTKMGTDDE